MKKRIIAFVIMLLPFGLHSQSVYVPNGGVFTPKGTLRALVICAEFEGIQQQAYFQFLDAGTHLPNLERRVWTNRNGDVICKTHTATTVFKESIHTVQESKELIARNAQLVYLTKIKAVEKTKTLPSIPTKELGSVIDVLGVDL